MSNGVVSPGDRAADFAVREQRVEGVCRVKGCSRRVQLDPKTLCAQGLGLLAMAAIKRMWRCQRLEGCSLDFHETPAELPLCLSQLVGRPNVRLRLKCREHRCTFYRVWRVEEMIGALEKELPPGWCYPVKLDVQHRATYYDHPAHDFVAALGGFVVRKGVSVLRHAITGRPIMYGGYPCGYNWMRLGRFAFTCGSDCAT